MTKNNPEEAILVEQLLVEINKHKPWEWSSNWKTQSQYFSWLRGQLRGIWSRKWVPKNDYLKKQCFDHPLTDGQGNPVLIKSGKNAGKQKTQKYFICEVTGELTKKTEGEVDHISPAGSCNSPLEACVFLFRLLTSPDNMRLISKDAHKIITHMERTGMSWEEASLDKAIIAKMKQSVKDQSRELSHNGYTPSEISNKAKRKECYIKMLSK